MPDVEAVTLMVSVPRELRKRVKLAAWDRDLTMYAFVDAALELAVANPDAITAVENEG